MPKSTSFGRSSASTRMLEGFDCDARPDAHARTGRRRKSGAAAGAPRSAAGGGGAGSLSRGRPSTHSIANQTRPSSPPASKIRAIHGDSSAPGSAAPRQSGRGGPGDTHASRSSLSATVLPMSFRSARKTTPDPPAPSMAISTVRADVGFDQLGGRRVVEERGRQAFRAGIEPRRRGIGVEQRAHVAAQFGIAGAGRVQVGGAGGAVTFDRGLEQALDLLPALDDHACSCVNSAPSQARRAASRASP